MGLMVVMVVHIVVVFCVSLIREAFSLLPLCYTCTPLLTHYNILKTLQDTIEYEEVTTAFCLVLDERLALAKQPLGGWI